MSRSGYLTTSVTYTGIHGLTSSVLSSGYAEGHADVALSKTNGQLVCDVEYLLLLMYYNFPLVPKTTNMHHHEYMMPRCMVLAALCNGNDIAWQKKMNQNINWSW